MAGRGASEGRGGARGRLRGSPAGLPGEGADDGRHQDERHKDEADIRPGVAAAAEGRADADGAGGGAPRKAEDQDGGREGAAHGHMRYTVKYSTGHTPTTKCQNIAHACTGALRPSPNRPRATRAVVTSSQTRAASTCRPCSPMSAKNVVP